MLQILKHLVSVLLFGMLSFLVVFFAYAEGEKVLMMATTTSTDNTGLLDYLAPKFKKASNIELRWTATGTGKALKLGENCDVDILMVHAPPAEKIFVDKGYGFDRSQIMYNDFVVIGSVADPVGIKGKSINDAMKMIKDAQATFVSRGDNSGTHKKECALWKTSDLGVPDKEVWYIQTGQGMLSTINIAVERDGYTMTDRGTYIKYEENMDGNPSLQILVEGDKALLNQYSVIAVSPKHCLDVKYDLATEFIEWMKGPEAQQLVKDFKLLGKPLFTPNAKSTFDY